MGTSRRRAGTSVAQYANIHKIPLLFSPSLTLRGTTYQGGDQLSSSGVSHWKLPPTVPLAVLRLKYNHVFSLKKKKKPNFQVLRKGLIEKLENISKKYDKFELGIGFGVSALGTHVQGPGFDPHHCGRGTMPGRSQRIAARA